MSALKDIRKIEGVWWKCCTDCGRVLYPSNGGFFTMQLEWCEICKIPTKDTAHVHQFWEEPPKEEKKLEVSYEIVPERKIDWTLPENLLLDSEERV